MTQPPERIGFQRSALPNSAEKAREKHEETDKRPLGLASSTVRRIALTKQFPSDLTKIGSDRMEGGWGYEPTWCKREQGNGNNS